MIGQKEFQDNGLRNHGLNEPLLFKNVSLVMVDIMQ